MPIAELTGGYRMNYAYGRSPLPRKASYSSADLDAHDAAHRNDALDMDLIRFVRCQGHARDCAVVDGRQ
jgi:hypothetical protein